MLLVRQAGGGWSSHVFGLKRDNHTRPIVEIDEEHGVVHMFATDSGSGGSIVEKTAPLSAISFAPGKGTSVITDADAKVNNATSTKQNSTAASGVVLLAHSGNGHYMHSQPVEAAPPPPPSPPGPPGEKAGRCTISGTPATTSSSGRGGPT